MSIQAMAWVIEHSRHEGHEYIVLLMIANHANREGENAYPDLSTLGHEARVSRSTVIRAIHALEQSGELVVHRARGRGKFNHYALPGVKGVNVTPINSEKGVKKVSEATEKGVKKVSNEPLKGVKPTHAHEGNRINHEPLRTGNNENILENSFNGDGATKAPFHLQLVRPSGCGLRGCTNPLPTRPPGARFCEEHGSPRSGYLTRK